MSDPVAVILAAGKGTRMKSDLPKVLCEVMGRAMIHFVLDALEESGFKEKVVVVGYEAEKVKQELAGRDNIRFASTIKPLNARIGAFDPSRKRAVFLSEEGILHLLITL